MRVEGNWSVPLFEKEPCWNLNYSDILTTLIQYAGRYCEMYASDLFIIWKYNIEDKLKDRNLESFTLRLGFRESGVDNDKSTDEERIVVRKNMEKNPYYYRKVVKLDVIVEGNKITMELN